MAKADKRINVKSRVVYAVVDRRRNAIVHAFASRAPARRHQRNRPAELVVVRGIFTPKGKA